MSSTRLLSSPLPAPKLSSEEPGGAESSGSQRLCVVADTLLHLQEGSFVGSSGPGETRDLMLNLALCGLQGTRVWP